MSAVAVVEVEMSRDEARALTDQINATVDSVPGLLLESDEGCAWRALGYSSWRKYAAAEFRISESQAYYLLNQARAVAALGAVARLPDSNMLEKITIRTATDIRSNLEEVVEDVRARVDAGESAEEAVEAAVAKYRKPAKKAKAVDEAPDNVGDLRTLPKARTSTVLIQRLAEQMSHYAHELAQIDIHTVDADVAVDVIDQLGRVRSAISYAINQLRGA